VIVVDTHAHLYPCYDLDRFLAAAERNLSHVGAAVASRGGHCSYVLCLTERPTESAFADLQAARLRPARYRVAPCSEDTAFRLASDDGFDLLVVAGRQIVTRERLELLALGVADSVPHGVEIAESLESVRRLRGVPVLPWSPGKWTGERGRTLRALIDGAAAGDFFLGDTALRPWPAARPSLFTVAHARGLGLLAGSDPLPLRGEERHVGRYVTVLDAPFFAEAPVASLRAAFCDVPRATAGRGGRRRPWTSGLYALARHALARV
jgi:hypothetical protein